MAGWGISPNASPKEKIKADVNDFLKGLNCVGQIDYATYSEIYDEVMLKLDKIYEQGTIDTKKYVIVFDGSDVYYSGLTENLPTSYMGTEKEAYFVCEEDMLIMLEMMKVSEE